jgi:uncharacterized protein (DUF488 family)
VEVYTIGFTKRTAGDFFGALRRVGIQRLLDVRLKNASQLAGFTKRDDLPFFLRELCGADYTHDTRLAPTPELLADYRKGGLSWPEYERRFRALLAERQPEKLLDPGAFATPTVLLCSETTAERCHRRLVLEHLQQRWGDLQLVHL